MAAQRFGCAIAYLSAVVSLSFALLAAPLSNQIFCEAKGVFYVLVVVVRLAKWILFHASFFIRLDDNGVVVAVPRVESLRQRVVPIRSVAVESSSVERARHVFEFLSVL